MLAARANGYRYQELRLVDASTGRVVFQRGNLILVFIINKDITISTTSLLVAAPSECLIIMLTGVAQLQGCAACRLVLFCAR